MVSHRQLLGALFAAAALSAAAAPMPENSGMVCDSMIVNGWGVKPVLGDTQFILERDAGDFTILPNLIARDDGLTPLASKQWAYRDLKAVGRNLDLVDMDELEDDDDWN